LLYYYNLIFKEFFMFKVLVFIFFSLFILSCSDLDVKSIKCNYEGENEGCPENYVCELEACVLEETLETCSDIKFCNYEFYCDFDIGRCRNNTCIGDNDCGDGEYCFNNEVCKQDTCVNNADCEDPRDVCSAEKKCVPAKEICTTNDDCRDLLRPICNVQGLCVQDDSVCTLECGQDSECVMFEGSEHCSCSTLGAKRCQEYGTDIQICIDQRWENESCPENQECVANALDASCVCSAGFVWNESHKNCEPITTNCTPNEKVCDGDTLKTCNEDGTAWLDPITVCTYSKHKVCGEGSDGGPACICDIGYKGDDCSECSDGYHNDGSDCIKDLPIPCDWTTEFCSVDNKFVLKCENYNVVKVSCGDNQICASDGPEASCQTEVSLCSDDCSTNPISKICNSNTCVECMVAGDCTRNNETCDNFGNPPSFTCMCKDGYHDEIGECVRNIVDGCNNTFWDNCQNNDLDAICSMTDTGSTSGELNPECICSEGYMQILNIPENSMNCTPAGGHCSGVICGEHGICREVISGGEATEPDDYMCVCAFPYKRKDDGNYHSECVECVADEDCEIGKTCISDRCQ
jgi:hypothetical protein